MQYDFSKIESNYGIKLDDTQRSVLFDLISFIEGKEHEICLTASAGTGKTMLLNILYDILNNCGYDVCFVTPTNKSKAVIVGNSSKDALTIHSLLNLRPNIDIMDYDATQLQFDFGMLNRSKIQVRDILLVDECSMINDDIYEVLEKYFGRSKIIYSGDPKQLAPVNQQHMSKTFSCRQLHLTKIYRQPESKIYQVLEYLRKKPIYKFKPVNDDNGNIIICNNIINMIETYAPIFKVASNFNETQLVKLVTYTNNRIQALNDLIRKKLYDDNEEYHEREVLTTYDRVVFSPNHVLLENSKDYMIRYVNSTTLYLANIVFKGYELTLTDGDFDYVVKILSKDNKKEDFEKLACELESRRQRAVDKKQINLWKNFFDLEQGFLTPIDLIYDNRVIKRKSIDYGYCISTHKAQSSGYTTVMIDMENIWRCKNPEELRQLQYVACSRTKKDLIIYQRD